MANSGFDGRILLTEAEWETYKRRAPVRYIHMRKSDTCSVCGKPGTVDEPLQHAHKIPFLLGVQKYKLTPDYLDREENIITAHRGACNKACELTEDAIKALVSKLLLPSL